MKRCTNSGCRKLFDSTAIAVCPHCGKQYPRLPGKEPQDGMPLLRKAIRKGLSTPRFMVRLTGYKAENKIRTIKAVRDLCGREERMGLAEANALVVSGDAIVARMLSASQAMELCDTLAALGAGVKVYCD